MEIKVKVKVGLVGSHALRIKPVGGGGSYGYVNPPGGGGGGSGEVDVPLRFYVSPFHPITLNDYQATTVGSSDLVADTISVGGAARATQASALHYQEGVIVPLTASGPVTAAFFAHAEGWGDWYIGSSFVKSIAAGGST